MGIVKTKSKKDQRISLGIFFDLKSARPTLWKGTAGAVPTPARFRYNAGLSAVAKITVHLKQMHPFEEQLKISRL
jgi:hypothetical protein